MPMASTAKPALQGTSRTPTKQHASLARETKSRSLGSASRAHLLVCHGSLIGTSVSRALIACGQATRAQILRTTPFATALKAITTPLSVVYIHALARLCSYENRSGSIFTRGEWLRPTRRRTQELQPTRFFLNNVKHAQLTWKSSRRYRALSVRVATTNPRHGRASSFRPGRRVVTSQTPAQWSARRFQAKQTCMTVELRTPSRSFTVLEA